MAKTTSDLRCCLVCAHFSISLGMEDYYNDLAGDMDCALSRDERCAWPKEVQEEGEVDRSALISVAERCPFFELMGLTE